MQVCAGVGGGGAGAPLPQRRGIQRGQRGQRGPERHQPLLAGAARAGAAPQGNPARRGWPGAARLAVLERGCMHVGPTRGAAPWVCTKAHVSACVMSRQGVWPVFRTLLSMMLVGRAAVGAAPLADRAKIAAVGLSPAWVPAGVYLLWCCFALLGVSTFSCGCMSG